MINYFSGVKVEDNNGIKIDPSSLAFRCGQGFFTTTRIYKGIPLLIDDHLKRINKSLKDFNMPAIDSQEVKKLALKWPKLNKVDDGVLRILVWPNKKHSDYYISGGFIPENRTVIKLNIASYRRHSSQIIYRYKSFNYWENLLAYQEAQAQGFDDAIILNEKGQICETSRYNIFWIKNDNVYTSELSCGLLDGIMRKHVLNILNKLGISAEEVCATLNDLTKVDSIFVTNSLRGIVEVIQVSDQFYKKGHGLVNLLKKELDSEIKKYLKTSEKD